MSTPKRTARRTIVVRRFPTGSQGANVRLGTIERTMRTVHLYVPSGRRGCASSVMEWRDVDLVVIAGREYVVRTASTDFGDERKGDLVVELTGDDPVPEDVG